MPENMLSVDGLQLCTESFGDPADPAVLLIMGATASMLGWPDELCEAFAETGRFVIRYDHRDTGRSTAGEPGAPSYDIEDLADDAVRVLDGYGVDRAHLVGMSLGGMIAQIVALKRPERVLSLTAISSSKWDEDPDLPGIDPVFLAHFGRSATLDWSDEAAVVAFITEAERICANAAPDFEAARIDATARREFRRAVDLRCRMNHAMLAGGEAWQGRLHELSAPVLVIHGSEDPILPHPHGAALATAAPGAELVTLEGAGHELRRADWHRIVTAIERHTEPPTG